ncbi:MAG: epoxyqueuosine reductase QueH [Thermodesulfobacteriota bacterium]
MAVLLHICCGPCALYPLEILRQQGISTRGFFHNPNIHPFREFKARLAALEAVASRTGLAVEYDREYGLREYLRQVVFHEEERCGICYRMRLAATAKKAAETGAEAFSSTLLYSRYQRHETIRAIGEEVGREFGVAFYYQDFRAGWQQGIDIAIEMGIYRQPYCGCIYSEQERYDKKGRKDKNISQNKN